MPAAVPRIAAITARGLKDAADWKMDRTPASNRERQQAVVLRCSTQIHNILWSRDHSPCQTACSVALQHHHVKGCLHMEHVIHPHSNDLQTPTQHLPPEPVAEALQMDAKLHRHCRNLPPGQKHSDQHVLVYITQLR